MAEVVYDWQWHPTSKAEADAWLTYESSSKRANVASSEFADESIIRQMATHNWGPNDSEASVLPSLAVNPNLTPQLRDWLDAQSANWSLSAQNTYWWNRYGGNSNNSNHGKDYPNRSFSSEILTKKLDADSASRVILEIADQFSEQMWHDLSEQKHLSLVYWNEYRGATFRPSDRDLGNASEEVIKLFSPDYEVTWVSKDETFEFVYARERAEDDDGKWHFEENTYVDYIVEEPFAKENLGLAIGAGIQEEDLTVLDSAKYEEYLEELHSDDSEMYEVSIAVIKDSPWEGIRYRDLPDDQKMNFVLNLIATLNHPFLGRSDGISVHLLDCLAKHDQTPETVKALIILQLAK